MYTLPLFLSIIACRGSNEGSTELKSIDEIEELLFASGLDKELSKITFCNTGHWAAVSWFALSEYLDLDDIKMYDGSMAEWDKLGNEIL